jgi:hypothetical protein
VKTLKILLSAYACEPNQGSETGLGWNVAREVAKHHEVWVLTSEEHRSAIEAELARKPVPGLHFEYYDLPRWARWWKPGERGRQLHYSLWQFGAYRPAKRLYREVGIDLVHHVTYVTYWRPSLLALLPVPFIWGPVGGGETTPKGFRDNFSLGGRIYEQVRDLSSLVGRTRSFCTNHCPTKRSGSGNDKENRWPSVQAGGQKR